MHQTFRIVLLVIMAACIPAWPGHASPHDHDGAAMTDYRFPNKIGWQRLSKDAGTNGKATTDLANALDFTFAGVDVAAQRITAALKVTNSGEVPVELPVFPCGGEPFPYGGSSPFLVRIDFSDQATQDAIRYTGILYPPAPPPPMKMTLPAISRTRFVASIDLGAYTYLGEPQIKLRWSFCIYNGPSKTGNFFIKLPRRDTPERIPGT